MTQDGSGYLLRINGIADFEIDGDVSCIRTSLSPSVEEEYGSLLMVGVLAVVPTTHCASSETEQARGASKALPSFDSGSLLPVWLR